MKVIFLNWVNVFEFRNVFKNSILVTGSIKKIYIGFHDKNQLQLMTLVSYILRIGRLSTWVLNSLSKRWKNIKRNDYI